MFHWIAGGVGSFLVPQKRAIILRFGSGCVTMPAMRHRHHHTIDSHSRINDPVRRCSRRKDSVEFKGEKKRIAITAGSIFSSIRV